MSSWDKGSLEYKEYHRNYMRRYLQRPLPRVKANARRKVWRERLESRELRKTYMKVYRQTEKYKVTARLRYHLKRKEAQKVYRSRPEAKARYNSISAVNQKERRLRVPKWLTTQEKKQITMFYENCPVGMVVDHRMPLCGKTVSGLHVLANLQYLDPVENARKRNNYPFSADSQNMVQIPNSRQS